MMKHRKKIISVIASVMLLACLAAIPVLAQPPPIPCAFHGTVTLDDNPVVAGTTITAKLGETVVGTANTYTEGAESKYWMYVEQVDGVPAEGATLNFYVGTYFGGTSTWEAGGGAAGFKTVNLAAETVPVTRYTLSVTISPVGGGTVSLSPTQPTAGYTAGQLVTLTASPASGYTFSSWSGDASGTSATTTVTMTSNKSVTAHFTSEVVPTGEYPSFTDWLSWW